MITHYADCWPVFRCQSDAGLPAGPIHHETRPHPLRWHLLIAGVGLGMVLVGLITGAGA